MRRRHGNPRPLQSTQPPKESPSPDERKAIRAVGMNAGQIKHFICRQLCVRIETLKREFGSWRLMFATLALPNRGPAWQDELLNRQIGFGIGSKRVSLSIDFLLTTTIVSGLITSSTRRFGSPGRRADAQTARV